MPYDPRQWQRTAADASPTGARPFSSGISCSCSFSGSKCCCRPDSRGALAASSAGFAAAMAPHQSTAASSMPTCYDLRRRSSRQHHCCSCCCAGRMTATGPERPVSDSSASLPAVTSGSNCSSSRSGSWSTRWSDFDLGALPASPRRLHLRRNHRAVATIFRGCDSANKRSARRPLRR